MLPCSPLHCQPSCSFHRLLCQRERLPHLPRTQLNVSHVGGETFLPSLSWQHSFHYDCYSLFPARDLCSILAGERLPFLLHLILFDTPCCLLYSLQPLNPGCHLGDEGMPAYVHCRCPTSCNGTRMVLLNVPLLHHHCSSHKGAAFCTQSMTVMH